MASKYRTARAMAEANEQRLCKVRSCDRRRHGMSTYCATHSTAKSIYGHPEGRRIRKGEYSGELREVRNLIKTHPTHPGIKAADDFARAWLDAGNRKLDGAVAPEQATRLHDAGVSPERITEELLAVSLWLHRHELHLRWLGTFETDAKAVGTALLHLAPRQRRTPVSTTGGPNYQRHSGPDRERVGRYFLDALRPLIVNVIRAVDAEQQAKQDRLRQLRFSFDIPTTTDTNEGDNRHG